MGDTDLIWDGPGAQLKGTKGGNGNELQFDQKKAAEPDALKLRFGVWDARNIAAICLDMLSGDDANPTRYEKVQLQLKIDDNFPLAQQAGAVEILTQEPDSVEDSGMKHRLSVGAKRIEVNGVPLGSSAAPDGSLYASLVARIERLETVLIGMPAPIPSVEPIPLPGPVRGPHGIFVGDFPAVAGYYHFASEDQQAYAEGRLTWDQVIERMDIRAR